MKLSIIVAMSRNRVIGRNGQLPWKLSADLQRFKRLTMGHPIIMGRKTYESIGRPLPGRRTIVISRDPNYRAAGVEAVTGVQDALDASAGTDETFVIGGGEIYSLVLPQADRLYITKVETDSEGDTYFPELDDQQWSLVEESHQPADEKNQFAMRFLVFDRATN